ncbi:ABC transporter substrate-binding protein [Limimonas halophila]|uniref:ABC transporter substrate-binding protein n=1 Tax=Limimonas halophila TaxID=1082479 RepID=UPI00159FD45D|nr:ABC transporter substrate-binding protein [Limimonas halophila]
MAAPGRVVSLNLCTDLLALRLLPRERIASVSALAADAGYSPMAERAQGIPVNHGRAEEVLRFEPDLVLAGAFRQRSTVRLLRRLGHEVVTLAPPRSIEDVRRQIRRVAKVLDVRPRGEAMIRRFDARIAHASPATAAAGATAAIYQPNGVTVGANQLPHAALKAAGLTNVAAEMGLDGMVPLSLEKLVTAEPDVLVLPASAQNAASQAAAVLDHPALRAVRARARVVRIPRRLWTCGGPQLAEAVTRLARARREVP